MPGDTEIGAGRGNRGASTSTNPPPDRLADQRSSAARLLGLDEETARNRPTEQHPQDEPSYYDIPLLKKPKWKWEIAWYFFLGGLSAGAFVIARIGEIVGGKDKRYASLTRAGTYLSAAAALPCAPLLILDLGDPRRFHHMLRVFKPSSPMSLGSWTLSGYTAMSLLAALREYVKSRADYGGEDEVAESPRGRAADIGVMMATDALGIPLAITLAGYTGVLLSTSANPLWCRNPWLGALFSASAMHTATSSIRLALETSLPEDAEPQSKDALAQIDTIGTIVEASAIAAYLAHAGELAKPLTRPPYRAQFFGGAVCLGLAAPAIIERLPLARPARRWAAVAACAFGLIGGFFLRWSLVYAGHESADDPEASRKIGTPERARK